MSLAASVAVAQTQREMEKDACAVFQRADRELNAVYVEILSENKKDKVFIEKLKKAQRAWIAYRDAHMESLYPEEDKSAYGSIYNMCCCIVKKELTIQRTEVLRRWLVGVPAGEACSGSIKTK